MYKRRTNIMSKKINNRLNEAYEAMAVYFLIQQSMKEAKREGIDGTKEVILEIMKELGIDEILFDNEVNSNKQLKAMKYNTTKLECIDESGLFRYLKLKGLHGKVFKRVPDMKELDKLFEEGNISLNEIKKFVSYKEGEVFKLQQVNK